MSLCSLDFNRIKESKSTVRATKKTLDIYQLYDGSMTSEILKEKKINNIIILLVKKTYVPSAFVVRI